MSIKEEETTGPVGRQITPRSSKDEWLERVLAERIAFRNAIQPSDSDFAKLLINGRQARKDVRPFTEAVAYDLTENLDRYVLHSDPEFAVLYKPAGVATHRHEENLERDVFGLEQIAKFRLGMGVNMVHRLDKQTSGAIVLAKTPEAHFNLSSQFGNKEGEGVQKLYLALLDGEFDDPFNIKCITANLRSVAGDRLQMEVVAAGMKERNVKNSLTYFRPLVLYETPHGQRKTLTAVEIVTGRTHQIRVVSAQVLNMPITGDFLYNPRGKQDASRPILHSWRLKFKHPKTGDPVNFEAPLAKDFNQLLRTFTPVMRYSGK